MPLTGVRVLLVEDDYVTARLLALELEVRHAQVEVWTDNFPELAKSVDWTNVDVVMCDQYLSQYDGKELLRWIREKHPDIRRVMVTADPLVDIGRAGADQVLIKPVDTKDLLAALGVHSD